MVELVINWLRLQKEKGIRYLPRTDSIQRFMNDLNLIRLEVEHCNRCGLSLSRRNTVFGEGPGDADLVIVGEAPGKIEDQTGRPFSGPSGDLLERMLGAIDLKREDVFITSVLKCRPPKNRTPKAYEINQCKPYLQRQLDAIAPAIILALGQIAARVLTGKELPIKELRGRIHEMGKRKVIVTYHPAYILRLRGSARERAKKKEVWEDLKLLKEKLENPGQ